jgi:G6PDH family F420-dependent oxidoreductase
MPTDPRFGIKLMAELRSARELVEHAVMAEAHGLEVATISDHIHPWLPEHDHSPFAWSVLGAVAHATDLEIATGLTCPIIRYHPVIIAQAAATVATMTDAKVTLALGAGERLNEHVTGAPWPAVDLRHEMLEEAIAIIHELWTGDWVTHRGGHFTVEDARIYDLPEQRVDVVVGVSGPASLDVADRAGADGIMAVDPEPGLVEGWAERGGDRTATWTEVPFAWAPTEEEGLRLAHERLRFSAPGWKVMAELPNPVNFGAATELVSPEDMAEDVPHGPDPEPYVAAVQEYIDAGFRTISIVPVGDDVEGTLTFWRDEVAPNIT